MFRKSFYPFNTIFFLLLTTLIFSAGCANVAPQSLDKIPEDNKQLALAEELFINEHFAQALAEFERVFHSNASAKDKNSALYGIACTRLILAESAEEVSLAIDDLQRWDSIRGTAPFNENQHLLVMALKRKSNFMQQRVKTQSKTERQKDELIADQKQKIAQLTSELEKLQKQLEALEAVEENSQEKRKPL